MKTKSSIKLVMLAFIGLFFVLSGNPVNAQMSSSGSDKTEWSINATDNAACSCTMFCQCYFNTNPDVHPDMPMDGKTRYCKFNEIMVVNKGNYGDTKLDGMKVWATGDLGDDFSDGEGEWMILTFEASATKEQRDGFSIIMSNVMPLKWKSFKFGDDATIDANITKDRVEYKLNGGKSGEIVLNNMNKGKDPVVINNLQYMATSHNDGYILMPNEIEAYKEGDKKFEFKGTSGWIITFDMSSKDVK